MNFNKNLDLLTYPKEARPSLLAVHCMNPDCSTRFSDVLHVPSLNEACPMCGERGFLYPCDSIHLLVESLSGPLQSIRYPGKRYHFACNLARRAWNMGLKHPGFPISYTLDTSAVNCADCLKRAGYVLSNTTQQFNNSIGGVTPTPTHHPLGS